MKAEMVTTEKKTYRDLPYIGSCGDNRICCRYIITVGLISNIVIIYVQALGDVCFLFDS